MRSQFRINLLVWVHLQGFPWWPARVVDREKHEDNVILGEGEELPKPNGHNTMVEWFDEEKNVSVLDNDHIREYTNNMKLLLESGKPKDVVEGCERANEYLETNSNAVASQVERYRTLQPFDELINGAPLNSKKNSSKAALPDTGSEPPKVKVEKRVASTNSRKTAPVWAVPRKSFKPVPPELPTTVPHRVYKPPYSDSDSDDIPKVYYNPFSKSIERKRQERQDLNSRRPPLSNSSYSSNSSGGERRAYSKSDLDVGPVDKNLAHSKKSKVRVLKEPSEGSSTAEVGQTLKCQDGEKNLEDLNKSVPGSDVKLVTADSLEDIREERAKRFDSSALMKSLKVFLARAGGYNESQRDEMTKLIEKEISKRSKPNDPNSFYTNSVNVIKKLKRDSSLVDQLFRTRDAQHFFALVPASQKRSDDSSRKKSRKPVRLDKNSTPEKNQNPERNTSGDKSLEGAIVEPADQTPSPPPRESIEKDDSKQIDSNCDQAMSDGSEARKRRERISTNTQKDGSDGDGVTEKPYKKRKVLEDGNELSNGSTAGEEGFDLRQRFDILQTPDTEDTGASGTANSAGGKKISEIVEELKDLKKKDGKLETELRELKEQFVKMRDIVMVERNEVITIKRGLEAEKANKRMKEEAASGEVDVLRKEMNKIKEELQKGKLNADIQEKQVDKMKNDLAKERKKNKFQENIINTFLDQKNKIDSLENKLNAS